MHYQIRENISDEKLNLIKENSAFKKFKKSENFEEELMYSLLDTSSFKNLIEGIVPISKESYYEKHLDNFLGFLIDN